MNLLTIYSSLVLNKSEYDKGLDQAERKATSSGNKIASSLAKVGKVVGVAFSVGKMIQFGDQAVNLANKQMEAEVKLTTVMKQRMNATDQSVNSIKQYASELQKVGVVGDEVTLSGAQQLATFLDNGKSLKTLIPAMQDLAVQQNGVSVTAENLTSIGNMFGKVMQGQTSALSRVGITFTEAEENALKYGNELERATTLAQVIRNNVGRMNEVMAQTPAGKIAQLKNNFGDLKEQIGNGLLVALAPVVSWLNTIVIRLQQAVSWAGAFVNAFSKATGIGKGLTSGGGLVGALAGAKNNASGMADSISGATDNAGKLSKAVGGASNGLNKAQKTASKLKRTLMGFDQITKISDVESDTSTPTAGSGAGTAGDLGTDAGSVDTSGIDTAKSKLDKLKESLQKITIPKPLADAVKKLREAFGKLSETSGKGLKWAYDNVLKPMGKWTVNKALPSIIKAFSSALNLLNTVLVALSPLGKWLFDNFLKPLAKFAGKAIVKFFDTMASAFDKLGKFISKHQTAFQNIVLAIGTFIGVIAGAGAVVSIITTVGGAIGTIIGIVTSCGGVLATLGTILGGLVATLGGPVVIAIGAVIAIGVLLWKNWDTVKKYAGILWNYIKKAFDGIKNAIVNAFKAWLDNVKKFLGLIKNVFTTIFGALKTIVMTVFKAIGNGIKTQISAWKTTITNVMSAIKTAFTTAWNAIKTTLGNIITNMFNNVKTKFTNIQNTIKKVIDKIKGFFNFQWSLPKLKLPHLETTGKFSLAPPSVPRFSLKWYAKGGIVDGASLFGNNVIGEAGKEAVIPLENHTEWIGKVASTLAGMLGSNQPINITVKSVLDGKVVAQNTVKQIIDQTKRTGTNPLSAYI